MVDIFISYSKADRELALKLSAYLESEGWSVWWDKSLKPADLFRDEIMKQLAAARAVISIWSETSIKSDWVRAEAGRAKAAGKLIPVKTPGLTYADIPLPFGEMHTENITSLDLIRASIVFQLAKPATPVSLLRQLISAFKGQILTWIGIVGGAITLFTNLGGILDLADWARQLILHWHEWMAAFWLWTFSWTSIHIPKELTPILSFLLFSGMLVIGINLSAKQISSQSDSQTIKRRAIMFIVGSCFYLAVFFAYPQVSEDVWKMAVPSESIRDLLRAFWFYGIPLLFPPAFGIYVTKGHRIWSGLSSLLFFVCGVFLLLRSLTYYWNHWLDFLGSGERFRESESLLSYLWYSFGILFQLCWMAIIIFTPGRELTRRLALLVLGMLTLVVLNEISKLSLHQYLQAPKASMIEEAVKSST